MPRVGDIVVLGLARSGCAVVRYAAQHVGSEFTSVTGLDGSDTPTLRSNAESLRAVGADVRVGVESTDGRFDLGVISPGIPPTAPLARWAQQSCDRLVSEIEFSWERSASPWLAVTGTNGKTTTTSLVAHLLTEAGMASRTIGNIGTPAIDVVQEEGATTALVAEVSSFQLALTHAFRPRVAVLLNITPDHLDWHGSMEAYAAAKAKVFSNQRSSDTAVVDIDDPGSSPLAQAAQATGARVVRVSRHAVPEGGAGVDREGWLVLDTTSGPHRLVRSEDLRIRGDHNVSNALAAAAAAHAYGAPLTAVREGLVRFEPIEHRLEPVGIVDDVEYFNDSKATNPDAVVKALTAFSDRPVVLLLGGRNKGNDFSELAREAIGRTKAVVAFGQAGPEIESAFAQAGATIPVADGLADAFARAKALAGPGDAVLLSPACASFDEFADYTERGRAFRRLVAQAAKRGRP